MPLLAPILRGYGPSLGEYSHDHLYGAFGNNRLRQGDVAVSPDLLGQYPYGSPVTIGGRTYRVADKSYITGGRPNTNTIEIWNPTAAEQRILGRRLSSSSEPVSPNFDVTPPSMPSPPSPGATPDPAWYGANDFTPPDLPGSVGNGVLPDPSWYDSTLDVSPPSTPASFGNGVLPDPSWYDTSFDVSPPSVPPPFSNEAIWHDVPGSPTPAPYVPFTDFPQSSSGGTSTPAPYVPYTPFYDFPQSSSGYNPTTATPYYLNPSSNSSPPYYYNAPTDFSAVPSGSYDQPATLSHGGTDISGVTPTGGLYDPYSPSGDIAGFGGDTSLGGLGAGYYDGAIFNQSQWDTGMYGYDANGNWVNFGAPQSQGAAPKAPPAPHWTGPDVSAPANPSDALRTGVDLSGLGSTLSPFGSLSNEAAFWRSGNMSFAPGGGGYITQALLGPAPDSDPGALATAPGFSAHGPWTPAPATFTTDEQGIAALNHGLALAGGSGWYTQPYQMMI